MGSMRNIVTLWERSIPGRQLRRRRRGAVLTVEMLFVLPLLVVVLLAVTEFSFMLLAMNAIGAAANVGAREAALPSSDLMSVEMAVNEALAGWSFQGEQNVAAFVNGNIDNGMNNQIANANTGDNVQVTVVLETTQAVPDMLSFIGLSVMGQELRATYVSRRE